MGEKGAHIKSDEKSRVKKERNGKNRNGTKTKSCKRSEERYMKGVFKKRSVVDKKSCLSVAKRSVTNRNVIKRNALL